MVRQQQCGMILWGFFITHFLSASANLCFRKFLHAQIVMPCQKHVHYCGINVARILNIILWYKYRKK